jgi:hypothetical protein
VDINYTTIKCFIKLIGFNRPLSHVFVVHRIHKVESRGVNTGFDDGAVGVNVRLAVWRRPSSQQGAGAPHSVGPDQDGVEAGGG